MLTTVIVWVTVVNCLLSILLGLLVLLKDATARKNRLFALLCVASILWTGTNILFRYTHILSDEMTLLAIRGTFVGAALSVVCLIYLVDTLTKNNFLVRYKWWVATLSTASILSTTNPWLVQNFVVKDERFIYENGWAAPVFYALLLILILILVKLTLSVKGGWERGNPMRVLRLSLYAVMICVIVTNYVIPIVFGNHELSIFGGVAILAFMVSLAYLISNKGLLNIKAAVFRTLIAGMMTVAIVAALIMVGILLSFWLSELLDIEDDTGKMIVMTIVGAPIFLAFAPVRKRINSAIRHVVAVDYYETDEVIDRVNEIILAAESTRGLATRLNRLLAETFKLKFCELILFSKDFNRLLRFGLVHNGVSEDEVKQLRELMGETKVASLDNMVLNDNGFRALLMELGAEVVQAVGGDSERKNDTNTLTDGFILLGGKSSGASWSKRDLALVGIISHQIVIGLNNVVQIEGIKRFNVRLQEEVEAATKDLIQKNKLLEKQDEQKNEFMSIASHQLKTPLTSMRGNLSMLADGDYGEVSTTQRDVLLGIESSAALMASLVSEFLDVSRLQSGKFVIDKKMTDMLALLTAQVDLVKKLATDRKITVTLQVQGDVPNISLDGDKIAQVMMNFMDNAIYYSPEGSEINIFLSVVKKEVEFKVVDQGVGIPRDEQDKLFSKFYRAKAAQKVRPNGVGIGLFLAKKTIDGHGGKIIFESKEGKGSTFGFRLSIE